MLKKLFYFYLFYLINSLKINNITHEYSEGVFKNAILKKGAEYFFANTADNLYKSSTLDGSKINSFSLNFSDNSSFIYVSELDIFIAACTKDFLLAIIDSSSKIHIIFKENIIKNYSPVQELIAENKCNLLYYFSNEDGEENFNLIFSIPIKEEPKFKYLFLFLNLNEYLNSHTTGNIIEFNNLKINKTQPTDVNFFVDNYFNYYPHSILFKNDNNFFSSFLKINSSSDNHIYNLIYCGENNLSFNFNNKFEFIDIYPIGAFKYNESGIFYGFNIENKNLYFLYPKFDLSSEKNHTYIDFSVDYDGVINNQIDYNTIKAAYINETHFILNYLYNENKLKIKIIDISNKEIGKKIFDFNLVLSDINPVKTYFNFILSYYKFSYLLSTENEKYYFILTNNKCDSSCRICFDSNEGINNKCVKCLNDNAFRLFEEMNNIEFQCFNECPIDYGYKTDKIEEHICYHKDEDLDGYFWDGDNFSPCLNNKCLKCKNNDKCLVCSIDFPYKLFEEINEFVCYDNCPVDYGYKTDKIEEHICYHKDKEIDGYYWDGDNFSPCPNKCSKCKNNDKCLECSIDFPYKLFEDLNNNEFECYDKCPVDYGYKTDLKEYICYHKDDEIDHYIWDGENFSPCPKNCIKCNYNDKCLKCSNDYPFRLEENLNDIEFDCFDECPIDYGYKTDKIEEYTCYHKDKEIDGYFWNGDNFSPCPKNCTKCINNDKCLECSNDYPYKLFEDLYSNEFQCFDKCPVDYGYKTDKKEEKICYNKDEEINGYYWDDDNFSSCPKNCTKCINNDKCLECSNDYPYKLFEEINNNEFKCFDKCPSGYESNKNDHICYNENPCYLELNQIKSFIPNFITYYINQSIQCENYIIQCFYYSKENIEKFYNKNKLSSKIYLDFNKLRLLSENKYIFFKLDIIRKDELLNQIEYKLYDENKNEVNLNNTQIQISIPVSAKKDLNEQLIDEYKLFTNETLVWNSSSPFYNDICYTFSENKKDVILEDRKKNYFPYDKVLDENCEFVSIKDDVINLLCDYKENIITENRNYTSNKIHEEFNISRTNENFKILKCPKNKFYKSYIFWICFILSIFQVIFFLYICKYVIFAEEKEENELQSEKNDDLKNININIVKEFDLENDENNDNSQNNENKKLKKKNSKNNKNGINLVLKKQITLEGNDNNNNDDDNDSNFIKDNKGKGISHFNMNTGGGLKLKVNKNNNIYHNNNDLIESSNNSNVEEEEENHENSSDNKNSNGLSLKIIDDSKNDNSNMDVLSDKSKKEFSNRAYSNFINDEEFKYMNYNDQINEEDENDKKIGNKFCDIYGHYLKYNELTLFTFFNKNDFNHKYLKLSLFVFYLCCIILFNIFLFSNDIFSKIYNKNKYPFADCLGNNFIVILVCYAISFGAKFFISTQHDIINSIKNEKYNVEMPENNEQNKDEIKEVSNNFNNSLFIYEKKIKNDKKKLIDFELKKNKCWVIAYFGGVIVTYVYTFIHTISFGIIFNNSQKFIVLNLFICYLVGIIFSLMFNLVSTLLRFFGVKNKKEKLFNLSFWTTITIY